MKKEISFLQVSETLGLMNNMNVNNYKENGMDQMSNLNMNHMTNENKNKLNSGSMNEINNVNTNLMNNAYMNQMNNENMNQIAYGNSNQMNNAYMNQMANMNMNQIANMNMNQMANMNMNQMDNPNMYQMNDPYMYQLNDQNMNQRPNTYTNQIVNESQNTNSPQSDNADTNFMQLSSKSKVNTKNSIIHSKPKENISSQDLVRYDTFRDSEMKKLQINHTWKNAKRESINDNFDKYAASTGVKNADEFVSFLGYLSDASIKASKMYTSSQNNAK